MKKGVGVLLVLIFSFIFTAGFILAQAFPEAAVGISPESYALDHYTSDTIAHESSKDFYIDSNGQDAWVSPASTTDYSNSITLAVKQHNLTYPGRDSSILENYYNGGSSSTRIDKSYNADATVTFSRTDTSDITCSETGCMRHYTSTGTDPWDSGINPPLFSLSINPEVNTISNDNKIIVTSPTPEWVACGPGSWGVNYGNYTYTSSATCTPDQITLDFSKTAECTDAYDEYEDGVNHRYTASAIETTNIVLNRSTSLSDVGAYTDPEYIKKRIDPKDTTFNGAIITPFDDTDCDVVIDDDYLGKLLCDSDTSSNIIPVSIKGSIKVWDRGLWLLIWGGGQTPEAIAHKYDEQFWVPVADGEFKDYGLMSEEGKKIYTMKLKADDPSTNSWISDEQKLYLATHSGFYKSEVDSNPEAASLGSTEFRCFAYVDNKPNMNASSTNYILSPQRKQLNCGNGYCSYQDFLDTFSLPDAGRVGDASLEFTLMFAPLGKAIGPLFGAIKNKLGTFFAPLFKMCRLGSGSCNLFVYTTGKPGAPALYIDLESSYLRAVIRDINQRALQVSGGDKTKYVQEVARIISEEVPYAPTVPVGDFGEQCLNEMIYSNIQKAGGNLVPLSTILEQGAAVCREKSALASCVLKEGWISSSVVSGDCGIGINTAGHAWVEIHEMKTILDPTKNQLWGMYEPASGVLFKKDPTRAVFSP